MASRTFLRRPLSALVLASALSVRCVAQSVVAEGCAAAASGECDVANMLQVPSPRMLGEAADDETASSSHPNRQPMPGHRTKHPKPSHGKEHAHGPWKEWPPRQWLGGGKCEMALDKECAVMPCALNHGPTQCLHDGLSRKRCFCSPGYCLNEDGICVLQLRTVKANVMPVNSEQRMGPIKRGLCSSGGGGRALSYFVGVLRGLTTLGLMPEFEELVTISGSSWASSIYMFAKNPDEELLGARTAPEKLTLDFLDQNASLIGWTQTRSTDMLAIELLALKCPPEKLWQSLIGKTFLEPFGLNAPNVMLAASPKSVARIKANNPELENATFYTPRPDRPPSYVMLGALLTPDRHKASAETAVALQMSPGQIGSPYHPSGKKLSSDPLSPMVGSKTTSLVGGGFVESFAFGGAAPTNPKVQSGGDDVWVGAPPVPFTLADAVGVSSFMPAPDFANSALLNMLNPRIHYWPVTSKKFPPSEPGGVFELADGGDLESSGLLPLLQRHVESVVWVANSNQGLNRTYPWRDFCGMKKGKRSWESFDPVAAGLISQLVDKFGYGTEVSDSLDYLIYNTVFERFELLPVACKLWWSEQRGMPAVVRFKPTVLPNDRWGLEGGNQVDVLLVYLLNVEGFNTKLPKHTQDEIQLGEHGSLAHWPYYKTTLQNPPEVTSYTMRQVNLLSALGEHAVMSHSPLFKSFLRK